MTPSAGRQNAVEHINAARDGFEKVNGFTNAHQVTRLVLRQFWDSYIEGPTHQLMPLTDGQTTNRIAIKANGFQGFS
jgi:hypothetical protein